MNRWIKYSVIAVTPTLSALHIRWIAYLLGVDWNETAQTFSALVVLISTGFVLTTLDDIDRESRQEKNL
jgi:hypothetical protein